MGRIEQNLNLALIVGAFALVLIVLYTLPVSQQIKDIAQWNINAFVLFGFLGLFAFNSDSRFKNLMEISSRQEFFEKTTIGVVFGIFIFFVWGIIAQLVAGLSEAVAAAQIYNLTSSVSQISSLSEGDAIITNLFQPVSENFVMVVGFFILFSVLVKVFSLNGSSRKSLRFIALIASVLAISFIFAWIHFSVKGGSFFEFSSAGFFEFVFNTQGIGTAGYVGAFPQLILGVLWLAITIYFNDWVVGAVAHLINNLLSIYFITGALHASSLIVVIALVLIIFKSVSSNEINFKGNVEVLQ